jgi:hypothetical protein
MPHFYFHLWRGGQLTPDEVGLALPSRNAAKRRAERMATSLMTEALGTEDLRGLDIEVADHEGRTVLLIPIQATTPKQTPQLAA